jgi:hypothetical protein
MATIAGSILIQMASFRRLHIILRTRHQHRKATGYAWQLKIALEVIALPISIQGRINGSNHLINPFKPVSQGFSQSVMVPTW